MTGLRLRDEIGDGLSYQVFPAWFQDWAHKEAEAAILRFFEPVIVPGLLQTGDYARAIFRTRFRITREEIEEQVRGWRAPSPSRISRTRRASATC